MVMHDELHDDHATVARASSISQRSMSSSITEKHASVPEKLPDEAVHASKKDADHEYRKYTLDTLTQHCDTPVTRERRRLTFLYFFIFIYILEFKCDDPENGVNKQTSLSDVEQQQDTDMDGGYGWLVILGTFMVQVTSFGTASCW